MPLDVNNLPGPKFTLEELEAKAKEEINEDPRTRDTDLKAIKTWIKQQPHLGKYVRQDDEWLLFFLRGTKFSLERAKEKLENWNTFRSLCPEYYTKWDVDDPINEYLIKLGLSVPIAGYDKHGRKVIIQRYNLADPSKAQPEEVIRAGQLILDVSLKKLDYQAQVNGVVIISDSVGATMAHMKAFSPTMAKKIMTIFEEAYPNRPKQMHMLNMPSFMASLYNMMKGFMKPKMRERMYVHAKGDLTQLHEAVGTEVLPEEYGGTNGTMQDHVDALNDLVYSNKKWVKEQEQAKSNEKKRRPGMHKSYSDVFGMEGSFRQLAFD